ncbi:MAG: GNAT family N-acetyltransferase [Acidimicrobiia bacterium]
MSNSTRPVVWDHPREHRLVVNIDGHEAELQYERRDGRFIAAHTLVPDAVSGRGVGSALARAAVEHARAEELVVVPQCSFVAHWLREHPEVAATVAIEAPVS